MSKSLTNLKKITIILRGRFMAMLTPYQIVIKSALKNWNGLSEEEAELSVKGSMLYAINSITNILQHKTLKPKLENIIFYGGGKKPKKTLSKEGQQKLLEIGKLLKDNPNFSVLDILSHVHDGWVKDNVKKLNKVGREKKKYQRLPIELIGFKEVLLDLLFVEPILNSMGIFVNKKQLEKDYNKRVEDYLNRDEIATLNLRFRK